MSYIDIIREMTDDEFKQYQKYAEKYCETHDCEKCCYYLTKFKERVLERRTASKKAQEEKENLQKH